MGKSNNFKSKCWESLQHQETLYRIILPVPVRNNTGFHLTTIMAVPQWLLPVMILPSCLGYQIDRWRLWNPQPNPTQAFQLDWEHLFRRHRLLGRCPDFDQIDGCPD